MRLNRCTCCAETPFVLPSTNSLSRPLCRKRRIMVTCNVSGYVFPGFSGQPRRLLDQLLGGDVQQLVLGGAVEHALLADLAQDRHGKRRDGLGPTVVDATLGAAQQVSQ